MADFLASLQNVLRAEKALSPVPDRSSWRTVVYEAFSGAWQRNIKIDRNTVLSNHAVFACQTLIASDISKLRIKLVAKGSSGIWSETNSPAFSPVLTKPNRYQTRIQFIESWVLSKLRTGNAVILKERDNRGVVVRLHVLDWSLVKPLMTENGDLYYELQTDYLAGVGDSVIVPASEIIHDRFNCLFHPLVGISPIYACGLAATQGVAILTTSTKFFENNSRPSGILTSPQTIKQADADVMKTRWEEAYGGENSGKVAVLGEGLEYKPLGVSAHDSQLIDQLKWTAEVVCSTYHVPTYKIGIGQMPTYSNIQALNVEYYSQCLQSHIEAMEVCLDEGLGIGEGVTTNGQTYGTEFDVENLLRMDSVTQMEVLDKGKNILTPNEARAKLDKSPVDGGDDVYRQQQDYSLSALQKRDAKEDPFGKEQPAAPPANDNSAEQAAKALLAMTKGLA